MLTSSVLNILGRSLPEELPKAARPKSADLHREAEPVEPPKNSEIRVEPPFPGMRRPLLPEYQPGEPFANIRSVEEFLRALDDVERVNRSPALDVFE